MTQGSKSKTGLIKWLPLAVLSLGLVIIILDATILNVSLRTIIDDLHTNIQSIQWVITAYSLMLAAFTVTGGRLGDLFGRKRMFMLGAAIFAVGSFIASVSPNVGFLIAGGAAALGPVVGGWLTTYASWRWAFRINVIVAAVLLLGALLISESRDQEEKPTLDFVGVALSAVGLLSLVFGFIKASDYGWLTMKVTTHVMGVTFHRGALSLTPITVTLGLAILTLFCLWELHVTNHGHTPLVSLKLFKNRQFTLAVCIAGILSLGQSGLTFAIPIFLQAVKHLNALDTGFAMLPMPLTLLIAAPASALVSKYIAPKRIIQAGLLLVACGFLLMRSEIQVGATDWALTPGFILFGMGMGFMMSQLSNLSMSAVSVQEAGEASGINSTLRTVGQSLGSAIIGAILLSTLASNLANGVATSTVIPSAQKAVVSQAVSQQSSSVEFGSGISLGATTYVPAVIVHEISRISNVATVISTHLSLIIGVGFILLALLLSTRLPGGKDIEVEQTAAEAHETPRIPDDLVPIPVADMGEPHPRR
jgi:MFS family permease